MCQRVLSANDPEPSVGSVVLDRDGDAWQHVRSGVWRRIGYMDRYSWVDLCDFDPVTLIHDGGKEED